MDNKSGGIGFFGILTIVFIVLKLMNVITWSYMGTESYLAANNFDNCNCIPCVA